MTHLKGEMRGQRLKQGDAQLWPGILLWWEGGGKEESPEGEGDWNKDLGRNGTHTFEPKWRCEKSKYTLAGKLDSAPQLVENEGGRISRLKQVKKDAPAQPLTGRGEGTFFDLCILFFKKRRLQKLQAYERAHNILNMLHTLPLKFWLLKINQRFNSLGLKEEAVDQGPTRGPWGWAGRGNRSGRDAALSQRRQLTQRMAKGFKNGGR